jgi:hypothetical protein
MLRMPWCEQLEVEPDRTFDEPEGPEPAADERARAATDRGRAVGLEEGREAAAVVEVLVGDDRQIDRGNVDAQRPGVVQKSPRGPGIEEHPDAVRLDVHGEPELGPQPGALVGTAVLDQRGHAHGVPPAS